MLIDIFWLSFPKTSLFKWFSPDPNVFLVSREDTYARDVVNLIEDVRNIFTFLKEININYCTREHEST